MKVFGIVSGIVGSILFVGWFASIIYMGATGATLRPAYSVTHEECQQMSEALSMMTASEAHNTLIAKVRDMGCHEQHYPIGVLVK
jgi:hypothetical protein